MFTSKKNFLEIIATYEEAVRSLNTEHFRTATPYWLNIPIKEKTFHGWLRPTAMYTETIINGRWDYWQDIHSTLIVENKPIPKIDFCVPTKDGASGEVMNMINDCLRASKCISGYKSLELFVDWILYAYGSSLVTSLPVNITDEMNRYWYENFKPQYLFAVPGDYLVHCASDVYGSGSFNTTAFYPTPGQVVQLMTEMTFPDKDDYSLEKYKYQTVMEPCCGSGIVLLYASNYSLRLFGQDIDPLMTKIAILNGYFYMPWLVESSPEVTKLLDDTAEKYKQTAPTLNENLKEVI